MTAPIGQNSPVTIGLVVAVLGVQGFVLKEIYQTREAIAASRDTMRAEFVGKDLFASRMDDMQHQLESINGRLSRLEQK